MQHIKGLLSFLAIGLMMAGGLLLSSAGLASADGTNTVDIAVSKNVDVANPAVGDTITYTIAVTNSATGAATGIQITDVVPNGVTFSGTGAMSQGNLDISGLPAIVWSVGTLGATGSATLDFSAIVDAGAAGLTITNTAILTHVDQTDADSSNDSGSVSITVQEVPIVPPELPEGGKRRGFVGVVEGPAGEEPAIPITLILQGTGQRVEIVLPQEFDLQMPGGPRAGEFVAGAEVTILARLAEGQWIAERVLVKPVKPLTPLSGVVVSVDGTTFTVQTPSGQTQTVQVPPGAPAFTSGEMITIFLGEPLPDEGQTDNGKAVRTTGLVRAAQVSERLHKHLEQLTVEDDEMPGGTDAGGQQLEHLARLLENHEARHLDGLGRALERASEKARENILKAREKAENARQRSEAAIQKALEKAGRPAGQGPPDERPQGPGQGKGQGQGQGGGGGQGQGGPPGQSGNTPGQGRGR